MISILLLLIVAGVKSDQILQYQDVVTADTQTICTNFLGANISEVCAEQLDVVCANSTLLMTMLDASSKFPYAGLGYSSRMDYGNFDQCWTVDHSYENGRILGEYCLSGLVIPDIFGNLSDFSSYYLLAVCRPDACSATDYNTILQHVTSSENYIGLFQEGVCVTVESNSIFTAGDITVLTIFAIVATLMVVSTTYDVYLYKYEMKSFHPLLLAFSVLSNGRKLLHMGRHPTSKEQIEIFHGLRVISMIWIVAGHGMAVWGSVPVTNVGTVNTWTSNLSAFYMTSAQLSVDTFFFMSGFLLAFHYFKGKVKTLKQQVVSVPYAVVHRYLRLTPAMLMIYLLTITFFIHMGSGPLWTTVTGNYKELCRTNWWRFFLYIQNYFDFDEICLPQTWYLSADMQLFLISPLVLIPTALCFNKFGFRRTIVGLLVLNIICAIFPMILKLTIREYSNDYDTHSRFIDYFIGIMLGFFMRVKIKKPFLYTMEQTHKGVVNWATWSCIILGMLAILICYQDQQLNYGFESKAVFESLMRPAWCIGLSWITYSCYHGYGGFVNWILCRPIYQILGRLTYCIYLVHITVIMYYLGLTRTRWSFSEYNNFYQFCGHYLMSIIVATFWTLAFESPLIIVEKYFLGGSRPVKEAISPAIKNMEAVSKVPITESYIKREL